jgi:two-component system sensor histidine kinase/response regulator
LIIEVFDYKSMLCNSVSELNPALSQSQPRKADRVLAVDDSPDSLFLLESILAEEGYDVICAEDGQSALEEIQHNPPDLVLLDVMMPGMDGYEVARRIRQHPEWPYIPVLLVTAHEKSCVVDGLDSGADDFIRKPIVEVDELLARVRSLLRLKHTMDERDQIARQREDFVSRLTHDLRTPLVAANRMLNLIHQGAFGPVPAGVLDATSTMIRSNQNLLDMVNNLLEVFRYEAGCKALTFSRFDLQKLVQEVVEELKPIAVEKGLAFTANLDSFYAEVHGRRHKVTGDRLELRRVLTNIIGNAIKFTDRGSVFVRLSVAVDSTNQIDDSADGNRNGDRDENGAIASWAVIEIRDTGIGISVEDQRKIFERFRQGQHDRSGSGLGLHLSRRIIEAHNGQLLVDSCLGKGSAFTVKLPLKTGT